MTNYIPELEEFRTVRRWMEDGRDLQALLLAEETAAAAYIHLAGNGTGPVAAALRQLAREAQGHAACLEGICVLVTGTAPRIRVPAPEPGSGMAVLRRCYGGAMRVLAVYEARSRDREYGPVFARLAARQQEQCSRILQIIAMMGR